MTKRERFLIIAGLVIGLLIAGLIFGVTRLLRPEASAAQTKETTEETVPAGTESSSERTSTEPGKRPDDGGRAALYRTADGNGPTSHDPP
jgi:hypothetical protein